MIAAAPTLLLLAALSAASTRESRLDGSKHNFFGTGNAAPDAAMDLCQFCHVPNRLADVEVPAPLWPRREHRLGRRIRPA